MTTDSFLPCTASPKRTPNGRRNSASDATDEGSLAKVRGHTQAMKAAAKGGRKAAAKGEE